MSRPRVLLDVDGPLTAGFFDAACLVLREMGFAHARPEAISEWDIMRSFGVPPEVERAAYEELRRPGLAASFAPREGARELVAEISEWADVYAVTSPLPGSPTWASERAAWLGELGLPEKRVVHAHAKYLVSGDALVDDRDSHLEAWSAEHPRGLAVLWREPHNARSSWAGPSATGYAELRVWLDSLRGTRP